MTARNLICARRQIGVRNVRAYCGNDGGLLNAASSPVLLWLARQLAGEKQC